MRRTIAIALALALPPLLYSGAALLVGLLSAAMQCDEICGYRPDWRYTRGAWEWYALGAVGAATFAVGIVFFAAVVRRRPWLALASLSLVAAGVTTGLGPLRVNPGSDRGLDLELSFFLVSAAVFASGAISALLALPARGRTD